VADRAGISTATLFRYFDALDQLRRDAAVRAIQRFPDLFGVPDIGIGPRDERVSRFAGNRVLLYEKTHLMARLLRSNALQDRGAAEMVDVARLAMADQVRQHFDAELRAFMPARREDAVVTIASLTSVESWEQLRQSFGRTPAQVRRAWSAAIDRILNGR
jgi:AcrR family transcriptional regulator